MMKIFTKKSRLISIALCLLMFLSILPQFALDVQSAKKEPIVVSMGDSYSAGEGIERYYDQGKSTSEKVGSEDWISHRSENSWPGMLKVPGLSGTLADNHNKNWYFVATSGATTTHIQNSFKKEYDYDGYQGSTYVAPQIEILRNLKNEGKEVDYITLTIGGNDVEFSEVVTMAATPHPFNPSALSDKINSLKNDFYAANGIRDSIRKVYTDIATEAPNAKIIVAGYPKLLDIKGSGFLFNEDDAKLINDAVEWFNNEIESLVNSCKADGMKICFVSVEEKFKDKGAYSQDKDDEYIYRVRTPKSQDIKEGGISSASSIHPTEKGAKLYAQCVQDKIDSIEKDGGKTEWPTMTSSEERDVVLVLDASGSMDGDPLEKTKVASDKFIDTVLAEDASIGMVTYDTSAMKMADFCMNKTYLKNIVSNIDTGGQTNMEAGLKTAESMLADSSAKKKIIVLMSDGLPNEGKTGDDLIAYADELKNKGIYIYTLGFFDSSSYATEQQYLMEQIASDGCHYEVDDADKLVFFFNDIAEQIQGVDYIYVRIACPVDVSVKYKDETLSSKDAKGSQRASFGSLTFEQNPESNPGSPDDRVKILRLKAATQYNIHIEGNADGKMSYTIGFMHDGEYTDMRTFDDIKITKNTKIDIVAAKKDNTIMKIDSDGDGGYDKFYKASKNEKGEVVNYQATIWLLLTPILLFILITVLLVKKHKKKKAASVSKEEIKDITDSPVTSDEIK